jgi:hypothetical protein
MRKADRSSSIVLSLRINRFEPPILHEVHGVYEDTYKLIWLSKLEEARGGAVG